MTLRFLEPQETENLRGIINRDPEFKLAAKFFSKDILLIAGESRCIVKVREGMMTEIALNPTFMDRWDFSIKASPESWEKFLRPVPPPFHIGLYSGMGRQTFEVGGDLESVFAHYWAVTRMLDVMRDFQNRKRS